MNIGAHIPTIMRYGSRILIFLTCLGIFYSLLYPIILANMPIKNESFLNADGIVIGLYLTEWDQVIPEENGGLGNRTESLSLSIEQRGLVDKFGIPLMFISLDYIYIPSSLVDEEERFCVQHLSILGEVSGLEDFELFRTSQILLEDVTDQACFQAGINYVVIDTVAVRPMLLKNRNFDDYLYPFDDRILGFDVLLKGYVEKPNNTKEVVTNLDVNVNLAHANWVETTMPDEFEVDGFAAKQLQVTLKRPWVNRILFFIIPIIALIALVSLIAVENAGSFWEVSIAMLGLWSVREILIPDYINVPTIVDQILTLMYILLLLIVITSLVAKFRARGVIDLALLIPLRRGVANLVRWGEEQIDQGKASNEEIAKSFLIRANLVSSPAIREKLRNVAEVFINRSDTE